MRITAKKYLGQVRYFFAVKKNYREPSRAFKEARVSAIPATPLTVRKRNDLFCAATFL